jgi:hypothetical protein
MAMLNYKRIERAVKLDGKIYKEIRDDKDGFKEGLIVLLCAGIIGGIWSIIGSLGFALIGILIGMPIGWLIGGGILHIFAKLLGGKSTYTGYLAALGYAQAPMALGIVPILGSIVGGIWSFICAIYATRDAQEISMGKAIIVVLLPAIIVFLLAVLFFSAFFITSSTVTPGWR